MPVTPSDLQAALYYESMPDNFVRCTLCPHYCKIVPDRRRMTIREEA
jgi:hypothetical protein